MLNLTAITCPDDCTDVNLLPAIVVEQDCTGYEQALSQVCDLYILPSLTGDIFTDWNNVGGISNAAQDDGVAAFESECGDVNRHIGARFIDHTDDAERHAAFVQAHAVGQYDLLLSEGETFIHDLLAADKAQQFAYKTDINKAKDLLTQAGAVGIPEGGAGGAKPGAGGA